MMNTDTLTVLKPMVLQLGSSKGQYGSDSKKKSRLLDSKSVPISLHPILLNPLVLL